MSTPRLPLYLLQELPDLTEIINSPLKSAQRIKYTCFDVSKSLIVFGATSGGVYVFNRHPCEFVQLIPNKDGAITKLAISPDERHIGFANGRGVVAVTACEQTVANRTVTSKEHQGNEVTAMVWSHSTLFAGDDTGKISVLVLPSLITKTIFQTGSQTIMSLDSRICQLDIKECMLLASTQTRSYICDTSQEQYRQIGQKLRDGEYGGCFFTKGQCCVNGHDEVSNKEFTEAKQYNIVGTDAAFKVNEKLKNTTIFCARPSSRLWEASIDGTVLRTHQFKQVLARKPQNIIRNEDYENEKVTIQNFSSDVETKSNNFPKVFSLKNSAIFSFKKDSLYFLNIHDVDQSMWCEYKDIVDCRILNDIIYVWLQNGSLVSIKCMKIDKLLVRSFLDEKFSLCAELCALYRDYLKTNKLSAKVRILSGLKEHLDEDKLKSIEDVLEKFNELKDEAMSKSGIVVVDNAYSNQAELSDDETKETGDENIFPTLKELSTTVTDKIITSKNILKEKWEGFEDIMKQLSETKVQTFEVDVPRRKRDENENTDDYNVEFDKEIVFKESSQKIVEVDEDSKVETDKICKSLYQHHILKAIGEEDSKSSVKEIVENYSCDIQEIYKLMVILEEYCVSIGATEESKYISSNVFLSYLSDSNSDLLDEIIQEEVLYKFFVESCISVNKKSQKISNIGCECGFPLPYAKTNQTPEYAEIIDNFIEKQWSVKTREQCYEICKRMPYLWRKILYLRRNEDLVNLLMILLQMLDEKLLHNFLPQFTMETWDRAVQLYAVLQTNTCLNCKKKFNHISVKNTLSWDDLGAMIIKSVGGKNAVKILEKNAHLIEVGELSVKFYHTSLLVAAFEKYDGTTRTALVDTLYSSYGEEDARIEICNLVKTIRNGDIKNTSLPVIVAANSIHWGLLIINDKQEIYPDTDEQTQEQDNRTNFDRKSVSMADISEFFVNTDCVFCGLPLTNEVLIKDGGLWAFVCGHVFHGACLDLNKIKLCPSSCPMKNVIEII